MADSTDYRKWLQRASQDLRLADIIKKDGIQGLEDAFCYICHQATEKLLKAYIVKQEKVAPRSHDLLFLLGKCKKFDASLMRITDNLTILNEYSVSSRYPGDFDDKRTIEDAKEAYQCICEIKKLLESLFQ